MDTSILKSEAVEAAKEAFIEEGLQYFGPATKPGYQPSQRRRKRSKKGNRLGRSLIHVDQSTKDLLAAMSSASGIPQIQLVTYAIQTMSDVMQAEQLAAEQTEVNKVIERSES